MAEDKATVRSVDRALQLLKCFTLNKKEMSLAELSKSSKLPKTTVLRLLNSLEKQGFVEKDSVTQNYKLGIIVFRLGNIVASDMKLRKISIPVMEELAERTKESININIIQENERVCIEKREGSHDLRQFFEIGKGLPLYKGASGKILLAYLPYEQKLNILHLVEDELTKSIDEMLEELNKIKEQGYAFTQDERVLGAAAVSVPILNYKGEVIAGLTISGATVRFTKDSVEEFIKLAIEGSKKISQALGYKGSEIVHE